MKNLKNKFMKAKILEIVNEIMMAKELPMLTTLNEDDRLREDLSLTSFDLAELTVKIEDEYDVDIFEDGLVNTIGDIIAKLEQK
jgi:acyl carrier protein